MSKTLRVIGPQEQSWQAHPLNLGQVMVLRQIVTAGNLDRDQEYLSALLCDSLPEEAAAVIAACGREQLLALAGFLLDAVIAEAGNDEEAVDLRFAAASVMKQFGGYTMPMLMELPLADFLELYRLALAVQADEALTVIGYAVAAALAGNLSPLAERCRRLTPKAFIPRPCPVLPEPEQLAAARRLAGELKIADGENFQNIDNVDVKSIAVDKSFINKPLN